MKLSGWIFIIIGAITLITAYFLPHLRFFLYIGSTIAAYGLAKVIFNFIFKEDKSLQNSTNYEQLAVKELQESSCKRCRNIIRTYDNFCSYCGCRLK
ncbi:hypothetical protein J4232_02050 [Candidatus Woesearchaeota archaeon]|nr:hypothetical protein [Candidatus Woesearchaeota archaeon]